MSQNEKADDFRYYHVSIKSYKDKKIKDLWWFSLDLWAISVTGQCLSNSVDGKLSSFFKLDKNKNQSPHKSNPG